MRIECNLHSLDSVNLISFGSNMCRTNINCEFSRVPCVLHFWMKKSNGKNRNHNGNASKYLFNQLIYWQFAPFICFVDSGKYALCLNLFDCFARISQQPKENCIVYSFSQFFFLCGAISITFSTILCYWIVWSTK